MKRLVSLALLITLVVISLAPLGQAQEPTQTQAKSTATPDPRPLTNKDVVDMHNSGLSADVVLAKIKSSQSKFDTSPSALAELKTAGIADQVILAMVETSSTSAPSAPAGSVTAPTPAEREVKVSDGAEIEIQLKNTLSGQEAKVGDIVDFIVVRPVQINGVTVFEKDASARARVTTAKTAGHWGHAGKLEWAMQDVQAIDGNRVPARFTKRELGDSKGGTVAVAAVATTVLLGPLGLLWGLKKGKPAIIPAGNRYSVFVHGDTTVKGRITVTNGTASSESKPN